MEKSWKKKLEDKDTLPKVLQLEKEFLCYNAVHKVGAGASDEVLLANPSEVVAIMKQVPKGKLIIPNSMALRLAARLLRVSLS